MTESEQIVYISCVEDVRYSFVSHLSEALRRKGIHDVFVDSDDLLSDESQSKVERARVSVMVLPGNHKVNLDKLVKVLECQKNKDQVVVPVLYGVRSFEIEWLSALDSKGFSSVHYSRKGHSDSQFVKEIVRDVYEKLFYMGRIGIYSKLLEIEKMVCKQPLDIRCVGIWGMPGIGKTTLAKAVFDQMSGEFDAYCFIEDYTKAIQGKGLYRLLEEQFLKEKAIGSGTNTKLSLLRDKLNNKRVLVVLDDVHNPLAVESFLGGFDWFGPKSLIIIISRDKQVFRLCRVNQIYEVQGLDEKEALQLFSLCASIDEVAERNLHEVSMKVIKYANGHPLALNFYGRELKGKKRPLEMETAFLELKERPPNKFVDAIKSSYETLNDSCRNIFLDIACFFQGENIDYVIQLLKGCGFFPHVGIDILVENCLVTVSENRVCMHNLIQDVGQQIGRRSRLWEPWSIKYLLEENEHNVDVEPKATLKRAQGTEEIKGMFLDTSILSFDLKPATFDNMLNLRLLKIYCSYPESHPVISFPDGYLRSLPNELRLLHWENYPLQFLPVNFDPMHLVEINMPYSQLCRLWDGTMNLEMLRTIRLCHSQQLVDIDDLLKAPNLEVIDLQGCTRLQSFPATGQLLHLRVINLSGCTEIKSFPEIPPNIETLHLQGTGITELQLSIVKPNYRELLNLLAEIPGLSGVSNLEQSDLKPLTSLMKIGTSDKNLGKLIRLELKDCSSLRSLPDMDNLELIKVLDLSGCLELETIQGFPRNLKELYLAGTAIRQVPQLPQSLELFNAHGCVSLKSIRLNFEKLPVHYTFSNCFDLSPQVVSDFLVKALANAQHIPRERHELNETPAFSLCVPSHANQNSTLELQPGSSVMTQLNPSWRNTLVGFAMLVEVAFSEDYCDATGFGIRCVCRWKNKEDHSHSIERNLHCWAPGKAVPKVQKDHMFVLCDVNMRPSTDEGNGPDILADLIVFEFFPVNKQTKPLADSCTVKRCGVRVITGNTSGYDVSPVLSLDPMEVSGNENEEVLRISYDGLQEMGKALFLYMAGLFNDEDVGLVAPLIANIIDMDVSYGLKVLANRSLIRVSSNGEIVMSCFLRQMGQEILHTESKKIERLGDNSMINTRIIENTRKRKVKCLDAHDQVSGGRSTLSREPFDPQKAISLPSSPQNYRGQYEQSGSSHRNISHIWDKVLGSPMFQNKPLLPYEEWNIDFSELTVGTRVGIGFFGEVFRGIWNGTDVAIKVFLEQDLTAENMEDFCNEISILSRLRHPNVILFLGACTKPPRLSLITEYMEMGSLYYLLHLSGQKKRLSWRRKLKMLCDICRGLMCIHRMGIVHRDIKSANCLLSNKWTVKICDFGLSRIMTSTTMRDTVSAGTPEWMAPELIRNEPFSEKCDIFSLGVIMWELCTLTRPWEGVPPERVVYAIAYEGARLEIPEGPLGQLIADCWTEPEQRPSCNEIFSRLLDCEYSLC